MFIYRWMDEEAVVHIYSVLLIHKKEWIWVSSSEVDTLEPVIQNEKSQKEKNRY